MRWKTIPIFFVFFAMGFEDAVGTFAGFAKDEFGLTYFVKDILPFAVFIPYLFFSIPIGLWADRIGRKSVMVIFLGFTAFGALIPWINLSTYWYLLVGMFFIGIGNAGLQVTGNPIMRDVSRPGQYSRNLTFAQFVKAIGSQTGPYVATLFAGGIMIFGMMTNWKSVFPVFFFVAVATMILVMMMEIEEKEPDEDKEPPTFKSVFQLLISDRYVFMMVLGIFLYVGAEIGVNNSISTHLHEEFGQKLEFLATLNIGFFLTAICLGRILGSGLHHLINAKTHFLLTSSLALIGTLGAFAPNEWVVMSSLFLSGLAFGNIFPTIFSILIETRPERTNELSALMVTGISGGAFIPPIMGMIADYFGQGAGQHGQKYAFIVPALIMVYILILAIITRNKELHFDIE